MYKINNESEYKLVDKHITPIPAFKKRNVRLTDDELKEIRGKLNTDEPPTPKNSELVKRNIMR